MPDFMKQLSTILGSSGALGVLTALAMGQMTWQQAVAPLAGCVVLIIMQEAHVGTQAQQAAVAKDVQAIAADVVTIANKPAAPPATTQGTST